MSKPDWKDAPDWAEYLAQDGCGSWYWFERQPKIGRNGNWYVTHGDCEEAICNPDWQETLEPRP